MFLFLSEHPNTLSATFLTQMPSSLVILVWRTFRTVSPFIMLSFSGTRSGSLVMHVLDVEMFMEVFYKLNFKKNDKLN